MDPNSTRTALELATPSGPGAKTADTLRPGTLRQRLERLAAKKLWSSADIQDLAAAALELEAIAAATLERLAALAGYIDAYERREHPESYNPGEAFLDLVARQVAAWEAGVKANPPARVVFPEPRTVLEVFCSACGALPGSACISDEDVPLREPHTARLEEAARS